MAIFETLDSNCWILASTTHSGGFNASKASFIGESLPEGEKPCFKIATFAFKLANFGVKLVTFGLKTVDPSFNRVPTHTHRKNNWWEFHLRFASVYLSTRLEPPACACRPNACA